MMHFLVSSILYIIGPVIFFTLLNILAVHLMKKDFLFCMPVTMMTGGIVLYLTQYIFRTFNAGFILLLAACIPAILIIIKKHKDEDTMKLIFGEGFLVFIGIYIVFAILDFGRHFTYEIDEVMHWGKMVRQMQFWDRFYSDPSSTMIAHKDYPPFISLVELLWCKVSGGYSEKAVTFALHAFMGILFGSSVYMFVPANSDRAKAPVKILKGIIIALSSAVLMRLFDSYSIFNTIYTDILLSVFAIYLFALIISGEVKDTKRGFVAFVLGCGSLMITKQMGIFFVMAACVLYFVISKKKILTVLPVAAGLLTSGIWKIYISSLGIKGQFDLSLINPSVLLREVFDSESLRGMVTRSFVKQMFNMPLSLGPVQMTYFTAFIIGIGLLIIIFKFGSAFYGSKTVNAVAIVIQAGALFYAGALWLLYMFCFETPEMGSLASYDRYMSSYLLFQFGVYLIMLLGILAGRRFGIVNTGTWCLILCVLVLVTGPVNLSCLMPQGLRLEPLADYRYRSERIGQKVEAGSLVFIVSTYNDNNIMYTQYYLDDITFDVRHPHPEMCNIPAGDPEWDVVREDIASSDYVYVFDTTDTIQSEVGIYAADGQFDNERLYKVKATDGGFTLQLMD